MTPGDAALIERAQKWLSGPRYEGGREIYLIRDLLLALQRAHTERDAERTARQQAEQERDKAERKFEHWSGTDVPSLNLALSRARQDASALRSQVEALRGEMASWKTTGGRTAVAIDHWVERLAALTPAQEEPK